jgi:hypothetical protein
MSALLITLGMIACMYVAGRMALRRHRSYGLWLWIAAFIGPLAIPLIYLLPPARLGNQTAR